MAAGYFLPVFPCCRISKQRYAYNGRYDIFDQASPHRQQHNNKSAAEKAPTIKQP